MNSSDIKQAIYEAFETVKARNELKQFIKDELLKAVNIDFKTGHTKDGKDYVYPIEDDKNIYFSSENFEINEETKRNYQEYGMLVEKYLTFNKIPQNDNIRLGTTPKSLQEAGLSNIPLETHYSILDKMRNKENKHLVKPKTLKILPYLLHNPVAIYEDEQEKHSDSIVVLLNAFNKLNNPIIITIKKDSDNNSNIVNFITSGYGKKNIKDYLSKLKLLKRTKNIPQSLQDIF